MVTHAKNRQTHTPMVIARNVIRLDVLSWLLPQRERERERELVDDWWIILTPKGYFKIAGMGVLKWKV